MIIPLKHYSIMKTTRFITALGLATLALTACTNEDEMRNNTLPEGAVHLTAQIEGVQTRAPQLDAEGKGNFAQGDVWGMYAYTDAAAAGENMEYKYRETVLYWEDLSETSPVTFSAHYPRITEAIANPAAYMHTPLEWNKTDDLLHATATASKGGTVALTFKHLMHRLIIKLTAGEGMTGTDLTTALINSAGKDGDYTMYGSVEVNLLTGAVNYDRHGSLIQHTNASRGNAEWKVAPQDLRAGAEWLRIMVGEDTWYYNVPDNLNSSNAAHPTRLESGKQLTLNLTLKKNQQTGQTEVELSGSDISGWGNGGTITDDVVIGGNTPADGNINMNGKSAEEVKAAIKAAFDAGITEFTLTGPIANLGLSGEDFTMNPFYNTAVTKLDLSGVTGWEPVNIDGSTNPSKTVVGVPETAFLSCSALQTVVLPEEVKAIGSEAFSSCLSLSKINLENVTHIGHCAFMDCSALEEVDMSEVITIYDQAFRRAGLIALSLPQATSISEGITDGNPGNAGAFASCQSLVSVEAPLLTNTGYLSFAGCTALKTVNMPELTEIKQKAFYNTGLESINLDKVTTVGKQAFERCEKLTEVELPSLATIGEQAFKGCIELVEIELTATTINGSFLFLGCTKLTTLSLPNAEIFGYSIVADCSLLTNLKLTAAGALVNVDGEAIWGSTFGLPSFSDFQYGNCALVLNADKQLSGKGSPTVTDASTWVSQTWKSIAFE
ncbi:leucine-rich repeat protein [Bacteroides salyersiae]|nr:leucine-rich repeat protein [Bacteroides salyersiae]